MSIWGIPWGSWKESKECPVSVVRLTIFFVCLHLLSQQIGLRYETLILESKELLRKRFIWCLWSTEKGSITVQKWSERGCWNQGNQVLGQLRDQGPLAFPNALKDCHHMSGMVMTMIPPWVVTGIRCNMCRKCSGIWRVHVPDLGRGRCHVPAHTPGSGSSIMIVHPPFISFPPPSPECKLCLPLGQCSRDTYRRQVGRQVGLCSYPDCPASRSFCLHLVPSHCLVSVSFLDYCLRRWPSGSRTQQLRSSPITLPGQVHGGTVMAFNKLNSHIWHVISVIFPLPMSVFAFLYFLGIHFYSNIVIHIFKNISYHLTEKMFCRSQKFIFSPR